MDITQICIRGDKTNGKRIIQFFERLGYKNFYDQTCAEDHYYHVHEGCIYKWVGEGLPHNSTAITLSDTILPSEWCVKLPCDEAVNHLSVKHGHLIYTKGWEYCGENTLGKKWFVSNFSSGLELTPAQFKALTEDQREIEGYVCPMDYYGGKVKKGDFITQDGDVYEKKSDLYTLHFPPELVEPNWQPVFKEEKIMVGGAPIVIQNNLAKIYGIVWDADQLAAIKKILEENTTPETIQKIINKLTNE